MSLVLGTNLYQGDPDAMRRQSRALDALESLPDVIAIDLQWHDVPSPRSGIRTVAALRRDSTTITGRAGRVKPIASDVLDALAAVAEREGCRYFAYVNSDIIVSPAAVAVVAAGEYETYAFSRMDYDRAGRDTGLVLTGCDAFAFDVAWWRANRHRFRPYILGEPCWDNVYASLLMCHGNGRLVNRDGAIRHELHATAWGAGAFSGYQRIPRGARCAVLYAVGEVLRGARRGARARRERSGRTRDRGERVRLAAIARAGVETGGARCEGACPLPASAGAMACGQLSYHFRFLIRRSSPSSRGPGRGPFKAKTRVRIPLGTPVCNCLIVTISERRY